MQFSLLDFIPSFLQSLTISATTVFVSLGGVWFARTWFFTRISESIKHEYATELQEHKRAQDQELQGHKAMLETQLQLIRHENEVGQLRTSLFFDHQRDAFQTILNQTAVTIEEWWRNYDPETRIAGEVPRQCYTEVQNLIRKNQLFLDPDCKLVLDILLMIYCRSMPFDDDSGRPPIVQDGRKQLDDAEYLQPRIAAIFQMKIGVSYDQNAFADIAIFGIIRFMKSYHIGSDKRWTEELVQDVLDAQEAVAFAREHLTDLREYLILLSASLRKKGWMANDQYIHLVRLMDVIQKHETVPAICQA